MSSGSSARDNQSSKSPPDHSSPNTKMKLRSSSKKKRVIEDIPDEPEEYEGNDKFIHESIILEEAVEKKR